MTKKESRFRKEAVAFLRKKGLSFYELGSIFKISFASVNVILNGGDRKRITKLKKEVKERDEHKCQICDSVYLLHVHHIDENVKNNSIDNLVTLCAECHYRVHSKELRNGLDNPPIPEWQRELS